MIVSFINFAQVLGYIRYQTAWNISLTCRLILSSTIFRCFVFLSLSAWIFVYLHLDIYIFQMKKLLSNRYVRWCLNEYACVGYCVDLCSWLSIGIIETMFYDPTFCIYNLYEAFHWFEHQLIISYMLFISFMLQFDFSYFSPVLFFVCYFSAGFYIWLIFGLLVICIRRIRGTRLTQMSFHMR